MCNFTLDEFNALYGKVEVELMTELLTCRRRKTSTAPKDALFVALVVLKHYDTSHRHGIDFNMTSTMLEQLCHRVYHMVGPVLFAAHVVNVKMADQAENGHGFQNYQSVLYATDVKFQLNQRPSGRFDKARQYFSGKHNLYGLKIECFIAPLGVAVDVSAHYVGSVSDLTIFLERVSVHKAMLRKTQSEIAETVERDVFENRIKY